MQWTQLSFDIRAKLFSLDDCFVEMTGWWLRLPMRSVWYQILAPGPSQWGQWTKTNSQPQNIQTWSILKQYIFHSYNLYSLLWLDSTTLIRLRQASCEFLHIMLTVMRHWQWGVTLISFCGAWPQPDVPTLLVTMTGDKHKLTSGSNVTWAKPEKILMLVFIFNMGHCVHEFEQKKPL